MFGMMATEWKTEVVLWLCCAGFAVIAMLISAIIRDAFETRLVEHLLFSAPEGKQYTALHPAAGATLMPRVSLFDLMQHH